MAFTPNHQQKVNECYPKKEDEGTVTGKLSSLIYYINARPQKLVKVATYLSVKVVKDVVKQKDSYNEVTLDITESIMKNCSSYFETFCPFALTIIYHMLQSPSYRLSLRSLQTFGEFCTRSKNIISSIHDDQFFRHLDELANYFAKLATRNQDSSTPGGDMWQSLGFQGINLVIGLEDFKNDYGTRRVRIVIESIWQIMRDYSELLPASTEAMDTRVVSESGQKCILTLNNLLSKSTATSLPVVINTLLDVCERHSWNPKSLCMFFFGSLALNVPSQFIFVVISSIFRHLETCKYNENTYSTLLFCIYQILSHNRGPLGFSALELMKNLMSQGKVATGHSNISLPVILSWSSHSSLPEPVSMAVFCMLSVVQYTAFMTQRYDILSYVIRKNFRIAIEALTTHDVSRETSFSDRQSIVTETVNPASFQYLQVIWVFLAGVFSDSPRTFKFSLVQSPHSFFEKIFYILSIDDRDTSANCLHTIYLMVNCPSVNIKELLKFDLTLYYLDHYLSKLFDALINESSSLPHFVLTYRIFRTFAKLSKTCFIRTVSCLRSLRNQLASLGDGSKAIFCTLMECLLLQHFSDLFTKIDTFEFKDLVAEMADSQVYVDLFENGEVSVLNRSFGDNHFEFEPDSAAIIRIYKNTRFFTTEESNKVLQDFSPSTYDLREKASKTEARQLSSFQDSFRSQPGRSNQDMSSKRSFLSLSLTVSTSSRTATPPKAYTENIYDTKELERRLSEASLANDSGSTVNVLSTEYDTLSLQVKADKSLKNVRKTLLE